MVQNQRGTDRGATLPEYALIVALVVIALLVGISRLEESSGDRLEAREDASGGQDVSGVGFSYGGEPGGGTGGPAEPPPAVITPDSVTVPATLNGSKNTKDTWNATVTLVITAGTDKVEGARAEVTFTVGSTVTTVSCPLASDHKGEVVCEMAAIPEATTSITMVVDRIYGSNITEFIPPDPKPTTVFACPASVCKP